MHGLGFPVFLTLYLSSLFPTVCYGNANDENNEAFIKESRRKVTIYGVPRRVDYTKQMDFLLRSVVAYSVWDYCSDHHRRGECFGDNRLNITTEDVVRVSADMDTSWDRIAHLNTKAWFYIYIARIKDYLPYTTTTNYEGWTKPMPREILTGNTLDHALRKHLDTFEYLFPGGVVFEGVQKTYNPPEKPLLENWIIVFIVVIGVLLVGFGLYVGYNCWIRRQQRMLHIHIPHVTANHKRASNDGNSYI